MTSGRTRSLFCTVVIIAFVSGVTAGCKGRLISKDQEIKLGQDAGEDYPYDYRALADEPTTAVAFPGGRIYIFRGMIGVLNSDRDKIAWVLGHETTHVARQHAVRRIERQLGYEAIIALIFGKKDSARIASAVAGLVLLDYGRDNENEADRMGMLYAHNAGYDPTAAVAVLRTFQEIQGREPNNFEIMFATHPGNQDRINHAKGYIGQMGWSGAYYAP